MQEFLLHIISCPRINLLSCISIICMLQYAWGGSCSPFYSLYLARCDPWILYILRGVAPRSSKFGTMKSKRKLQRKDNFLLYKMTRSDPQKMLEWNLYKRYTVCEPVGCLGHLASSCVFKQSWGLHPPIV